MLPQSFRPCLAFFLAIIVLTGATPSVVAVPIEGSFPPEAADCVSLLEEVTSGPQALDRLGDSIQRVAIINRRSVEEIQDLLMNVEAFKLDRCGRGFFAETVVLPQQSPLPSQIGDPLRAQLPASSNPNVKLSIDKNETFKLHSKPDSKKTIYIDFNGAVIEGTQWNFNFNKGEIWNAVGFSIDSDFSSYTDEEHFVIQSIWQRVSEDFAPFDVNVTTEEPRLEALSRSDLKDEEFGTTVLVSNDAKIFKSCKCSGLAYLGSFDLIGKTHRENQPAWVFTQGVGSNPKYIAESVTHEVGHTLGLSHDGEKDASYYSGANGWAPIMGVGFHQPLTQWSKGDYLGADNQENDYEIMAKHGLALRPDEDGNSLESARVIPVLGSYSGIISSPADIDYFSFTPTTNEEFSIVVEPASVSPNLDLSLSVYQKSNPKSRVTNNLPNTILSSDIIQGLSARISTNLKKDIEYVIEVEGSSVLIGDSQESKFGSLGIYRLTVIKGRDAGKTLVLLPGNARSLGILANRLILPAERPGMPQKLALPMDAEPEDFSKVGRLGRYPI